MNSTKRTNTVGWRRAWRRGLCPLLPTAGLIALRDALTQDSPELRQQETTGPPLRRDSRCRGACAVALCGWKGKGLQTVGDVEDFFVRASMRAGRRLTAKAVDAFFAWYDDAPREEMRRGLLRETDHELARRVQARA